MTHTEALRLAVARLEDMLRGDDSQAWKEAEKAMPILRAALAAPSVPSGEQARWYCVSRVGLATLCNDEDDARATAADCDLSWPNSGPHRAVQLIEATPQPAPAGWRLVPEELTAGMLMAFHEISDADAMQYGQAGACWRAMLAAAGEPK